jgi:hypothetical protein
VKTVALVAVMVVRVAALILIVLGVLFWTGRATGLVSLHILIGLLLVLALWALAIAGLQYRIGAALPVLAFIWGAVVVVFGITQRQLLPGDTHWLIQWLHLLVGLAAVGLAEALSVRIRRA